MTEAEFERLLLEQMVDRKIAAARRQVFAVIAIAFVAAVVVAVGALLLLLHFWAAFHWPPFLSSSATLGISWEIIRI